MPWVTTHYRFEEVKRTARKKTNCLGCGKSLNRQNTFSQTINPRNKNAAGEPKTYSEIQAELKVQCNEWEPRAVCKQCLEGKPHGDGEGCWCKPRSYHRTWNSTVEYMHVGGYRESVPATVCNECGAVFPGDVGAARQAGWHIDYDPDEAGKNACPCVDVWIDEEDGD